MTNIFVLVQGQENRDKLQQVASQLEVHEQQLKEIRTTQEKMKETKMTGMVFTTAFPLGRHCVERKITFLWLGLDLRLWGLGISVLCGVGVSVLCGVGVNVLYRVTVSVLYRVAVSVLYRVVVM